MNPSASLLRTLNAGAIIVAALYFGQELLVPLSLAAILAFVLAPASNLLERARLPRMIAVLVTVVLASTLIGSIGMVVTRQLQQILVGLPGYEQTVAEKWRALVSGGGTISRVLAGLPAAIDPTPAAGGVSATIGLTLARRFAQPLLGPLATAAVVVLFTVFILLARQDLRDRLVRLVGRQGIHRTILALDDAGARLSRFFLFQLGLNAAFGLLIGISMAVAGTPAPVLWGIVAAVMRFVPYVGTPIAMVPAVLLAVASAPGWAPALLVLGVFLGAELVMGQAIEPLVYGHSTGLSPLAVIVATAFWALLWGPVGLLLATPLTLCLVVVGRNVAALSFLDVVLGDQPPLQPQETFYQRVLEGRAQSLLRCALRQVKAGSLTAYYDRVALPGLALAQADLLHDALSFERLESIHLPLGTLLTRLANGGAPGAPLPGGWAAADAVLCVTGRGQLDGLAADMVVRVLGQAGFGVTVTPGGSLSQSPQPGGTRLCCLSVLDGGSAVAAIRLLVRRIHKQVPGAPVVVCLWHAAGESPTLVELRQAEKDIHILFSLGELLAYAATLVSRDSLTRAV